MKEELKRELLATKGMAQSQVRAILSLHEEGLLDAEVARVPMRAYVLAKYSLTEDEADTDSIEGLAARSLEKVLSKAPSMLTDADRPATCDGARSVDTKQALLFHAVNKEFGLDVGGMEYAFAGTTSGLARIVADALAKRR